MKYLSQTTYADAVVSVFRGTRGVRLCFCSNRKCFDAARLLNGERPVQLNGVYCCRSCSFDTEAEPRGFVVDICGKLTPK